MTTSISSKGQVTVPIKLRKLLGLTPGTRITFEAGPNTTLVARKASEGSFFTRFQGSGNSANVSYRDSHHALQVLRGPVARGDVD